MDEAAVRRKLYGVARQVGYWPITQTDATKCSRCGQVDVPPKGRPDILWLHPHQASRVCEIKVLRAGETSFPFSRIEDKQRKWLNRWTKVGGLGYLGLGVIRQHGKRQWLDYLYLIDWVSWLDIEEIVGQVQQSIPLEAGPGYRSELQEQNWDILHLCEEWHVTRENGEWHLPEGHTAWTR